MKYKQIIVLIKLKKAQARSAVMRLVYYKIGDKLC